MKMRIAFFAGTMRRGQDGVTRVLYRLSDYLKEKKIEHIFFSPIVPEKKDRSVPMYEVPSVSTVLYSDYRLALPGQKYIKERLDEFRPDILHIHSPCMLGYNAIKFGQDHDIPVVATYHTHFASYAKYHHLSLLEGLGWSYFRYLYNKCDRVFVPSAPILNELREHGIQNLQHIPHGVDPVLFSPAHFSGTWKTKLGIEGKTALLFVGRLVWEKDLKTLARAWRILAERRSDFSLVLAGDGPIRQELERMMPGAIFLGNQRGKALSTAYASSDIFVFPSTTETFGNVTLEAMASGLAPVCANEGGASGFIRDGITGLLTNPRDPEDLAMKIEYLLDNHRFRENIAHEAYVYGHEQTWESSFDQIVRSYGEIIGEHDYLSPLKNLPAPPLRMKSIEK
jgi:phosphatidylinositol alpha 1,6-mannosyltransferase